MIKSVQAKQGLTLKWVYKDQKCGLRTHLKGNHVFKEEERRKGGKARVWLEIKFWLALLSIPCS